MVFNSIFLELSFVPDSLIMNFRWNCNIVFFAGKNFLFKKCYEFQKNFRTVTCPWSSATSWCRPWSTLTRSTQTSGFGSPQKSMRDSPLDCFRLEQRKISLNKKKKTNKKIILFYGMCDYLLKQNIKRQNYIFWKSGQKWKTNFENLLIFKIYEHQIQGLKLHNVL